MAVETRHLNLFPPQLVANSVWMGNIDGNNNAFVNPIGFGVPTLGSTEPLLPMIHSGIADSFLSAAPMNSESGLTYSFPVSRKRSRDSFNSFYSPNNGHYLVDVNRCGSFTFLGEDFTSQIQQQGIEIDCLISQHTEKVIFDIEELHKQQSRRIVAAVEEGIKKKLRAKEAEIDNIGKLNWALEEKAKSLYMENQIWRDLAQTSEATANALRSNLEQVLAQVNDERHHSDLLVAGPLIDDAQSSCGCNYSDDDNSDEDNSLQLAENRREINAVNDKSNHEVENDANRWCRKCRKEEPCVLLLPCRHLCLCSACCSWTDTCPICKSNKNASVTINMSC